MHKLNYLGLTTVLALAPFTTFASDAAINSVTATSSDASLSATNNLTVEFTTTTVIPESSNITITMWNSDGSAIDPSLDFSSVTSTGINGYTSLNQISSDMVIGSATIDAISIDLSADLPANTYTVTFSNIVNTAIESAFTVGVSTANEQALLLSSSYTLSDILSITDAIPVSAGEAIGGLKVKNITTNSATLKWNAFTGDNEVTYTVVLLKKNGEKVKTFTGLTTLKKEVAKSTKFLKPGKSYKFKVKACDAADAENCTEFSVFKNFTMLAE